LTYICNETLTDELNFTKASDSSYEKIKLVDNVFCKILIFKK
jgi:hypothetical protein